MLHSVFEGVQSSPCRVILSVENKAVAIFLATQGTTQRRPWRPQPEALCASFPGDRSHAFDKTSDVYAVDVDVPKKSGVSQSPAPESAGASEPAYSSSEMEPGQKDASHHDVSPSPWPHTMLILQDVPGDELVEERGPEPSGSSDQSSDAEKEREERRGEREPTSSSDRGREDSWGGNNLNPSHASSWARKAVSTSPARAALKRMTQSILSQMTSLKESIYGEEEAGNRREEISQESLERLAQPTLAASHCEGYREYRAEHRGRDGASQGVDVPHEEGRQESSMPAAQCRQPEQARSPAHGRTPPVEFLDRLHPESPSRATAPGHEGADEVRPPAPSPAKGSPTKVRDGADTAVVSAASCLAGGVHACVERNISVAAPRLLVNTSPSPWPPTMLAEQGPTAGLQEVAMTRECIESKSLEGVSTNVCSQSAATPSFDDLPLSQADLEAASPRQCEAQDAGHEEVQLAFDQTGRGASDPPAAGEERAQPPVTPLRATLMAAHDLRSELLENVAGEGTDGEVSSPQRSWYMGSMASREILPADDCGHPPPSSTVNLTKLSLKTFRRPLRTPSQRKLPQEAGCLSPQTPPNVGTRAHGSRGHDEVSFDTPTLPAPAEDKHFGNHPQVPSQSQNGQTNLEIVLGNGAPGVQGEQAQAAPGEKEETVGAVAAEKENELLANKPGVVSASAAGFTADGDNGAHSSEQATEWECRVEEPESLASHGGCSLDEEDRTEILSSRADPRDESKAKAEHEGTSRRVDSPGNSGDDAHSDCTRRHRRLFDFGPLAWVGSASAAFLDFSERLPELLTPSHLLRPRKLRPGVRQLLMQCHGAPPQLRSVDMS